MLLFPHSHLATNISLCIEFEKAYHIWLSYEGVKELQSKDNVWSLHPQFQHWWSYCSESKWKARRMVSCDTAGKSIACDAGYRASPASKEHLSNSDWGFLIELWKHCATHLQDLSISKRQNLLCVSLNTENIEALYQDTPQTNLRTYPVILVKKIDCPTISSGLFIISWLIRLHI